MADITMCTNKECTLKEKCYRYTAPVNKWRQSYYMDNPKQNEDGKCSHFWDNKGYQCTETKRK